MPKVVPPKVFYASPLEGFSPSFGIGCGKRLALVREYPAEVLADLAAQNRNGGIVNRCAYCAVAFGLVAVQVRAIE
ncbi:hypothetical protein JCM19000A_32170 [Silvimonas sp. JCM 19000]